MCPDRMMWGTGLALAGAVLAGLVLNLATGLTRLSWAVALAIAVAACACAGLVIRRRRRDRGADEVAPAHVPRGRFRPSPVTSGFLLLAAVLAGGAVWLADASAGWQHPTGFAQLWLTPATGATATLGVRDSYPDQQTFRLVLRGSAGQVLGAWDLALSDGETWQHAVTRPDGGTLSATLGGPGQALTVTS